MLGGTPKELGSEKWRGGGGSCSKQPNLFGNNSTKMNDPEAKKSILLENVFKLNYLILNFLIFFYLLFI